MTRIPHVNKQLVVLLNGYNHSYFLPPSKHDQCSVTHSLSVQHWEWDDFIHTYSWPISVNLKIQNV
jgi:hypothetical protein